MNRRHFFATTGLTSASMTPAERAAGRFMRAPDHPLGEEGSGGGGDSSQNPDNGTGNSGDSNNNSGTPNNTGAADPTAGFWDQKPEDENASDDSDETGKNLGKELAGIIQNTSFQEIFSKDTIAKIGEGDFGDANAAIAAAQRQTLTQGIAISAKLVSQYVEHRMAQVEKMIEDRIGKSKANETLEETFPAAKDPSVRPMIQKVFDQAMVNSKGNREAAIKLTKDMLNVFGDKTGLRTPPSDPSGNSGGSSSLVDELLGRS